MAEIDDEPTPMQDILDLSDNSWKDLPAIKVIFASEPWIVACRHQGPLTRAQFFEDRGENIEAVRGTIRGGRSVDEVAEEAYDRLRRLQLSDHLEATADWAVRLAKANGWEGALADLATAGLLHNIGIINLTETDGYNQARRESLQIANRFLPECRGLIFLLTFWRAPEELFKQFNIPLGAAEREQGAALIALRQKLNTSGAPKSPFEALIYLSYAHKLAEGQGIYGAESLQPQVWFERLCRNANLIPETTPDAYDTALKLQRL